MLHNSLHACMHAGSIEMSISVGNSKTGWPSHPGIEVPPLPSTHPTLLRMDNWLDSYRRGTVVSRKARVRERKKVLSADVGVGCGGAGHGRWRAHCVCIRRTTWKVSDCCGKAVGEVDWKTIVLFMCESVEALP